MALTTQQIDALKKITSPSVANAIETFNVRPREQGNLSSDIKALFPEMGPMVGYACTAIIRAESGSALEADRLARGDVYRPVVTEERHQLLPE